MFISITFLFSEIKGLKLTDLSANKTRLFYALYSFNFIYNKFLSLQSFLQDHSYEMSGSGNLFHFVFGRYTLQFNFSALFFLHVRLLCSPLGRLKLESGLEVKHTDMV